MKLKTAQIRKFRSIDDSGAVELGEVTCFVGKNESGKTAFLQALARMRPAPGQTDGYDAVMDYPSKDYGSYRRRSKRDGPAIVADVVFKLSDAELADINERFGAGVLGADTVRLTRNYDNGHLWYFGTDDATVIAHLVEATRLDGAVRAQAAAQTTVPGLAQLLEGLPEPSTHVEQVLQRIASWGEHGYRGQIRRIIDGWGPRFFYFDDYSVMRGRISVEHLKQKISDGSLDEADRTFLAFLAMGGAELEEFEDTSNFERLTRELEATANSIGAQVFKYWTQNENLRVNVQVSQANPEDDPPLNSGTILNVRIYNERHGVTVPFDERSRGFVWFFSFLAYFSELSAAPGSLVLLLDEPGLSLHAKAQGDFLRFIADELAGNFQVIYTTHSPFLIDPAHLERVRTVEDRDDRGTVVSADIFANSTDTVFPLQAALGYDLAQTLFLGPDCLLVEGPSDLVYLQVLGEAVRAAGGEALDERWVITPVGGADKLPTFVSLIGANQLNLAVLLDVSKREQQRVRELQNSGHLGKSVIVEIGQFIGRGDADIEDLFAQGFYLKLVNGAYKNELSGTLKVGDLTDQNPRIVRRIEMYFKANSVGPRGLFSHYRPAAYLQREMRTLLGQIDPATIERAKQMFAALNALLS